MTVYLAIFDRVAHTIGGKLFSDIAAYIVGATFCPSHSPTCITHPPKPPKTTVVQGGDSLEISIRDAQKIVEVWLTNAEKNDPAVAARLTPLYRAYQKQKYTVAVFQSGGADLLGCTRDLLRYNRKRIAELETLREKSASPAAPKP